MFEKLKKIFKNREEKEKHNYDLTFDNVAIPEVHIRNRKINKLNNMYIMQKGLPRAMSKFLT